MDSEDSKSFMDRAIENFKSPSFLMYIAIVALFLGIGYMIYVNYISPRLRPSWIANDEYDHDGERDLDVERKGTSAGDDDGGGDDGGGGDGGSTVSCNQPFSTEKGCAQIYLFHAQWCPYSKKVWQHWDKVKNALDKTRKNGYQLSFVEIDGDRQENDVSYFETHFLKNADKKKIDGYPSIYLFKDEQVYEFEAAPSEETLTDFINAVV